MMSSADVEVDFGFFTISPAEYRAACEAVVAVTLGWAVEPDDELSLLDQPMTRTPAKRSAKTI